MRLLARHHSSFSNQFLTLFSRQKLPEVTSFPQHAQFGPGSSVDKTYPSSNLKEVFSKIGAGTSSKEISGLFGYPLFAKDKGFYTCWFMCESHCEELVDKIVSSPPSVETLRLFDDLSNTICIFADCVKFIGENPPDKKVAEAATVCTINANNYVEKLNTNIELFKAIKAVSEDPAIMSELSEVDLAALRSFLHDMELSGIHLPRESRDQYVRSMSQIGAAGDRFVQLAHQPVKIRTEEAPAAIRNYAEEKEFVAIGGSGSEHFQAGVREFTWKNYNRFDEGRESELLNLLSHRHELASNLGYTSFAERELRHTMAGSPEKVSSFLTNLHAELAPLVDTELQHIKFSKADDQRHDQRKTQIFPQCAAYYPRRLSEQFLVENHVQGQMFLDMLEVENVVEGLNIFCEDILRISLVVEEPMRGELVDNNVVKLGVFDEKEGLIGYIYADLFERETKSPRTCLHTITCGTTRQLPVVVLQCAFVKKDRSQAVYKFDYPKLSLDQVQTLFHEFGHALHAILGRTAYQATSGTRGPTDFAEIPSSLFENFISHPQVYYSVISPLLVYSDQHFQHSSSYLFNTPYTALKTQTNILYSLIDQALHSGAPPARTCDVVDALTARYSHITPIAGTAWHQRFSHLQYYGARYYSYLWSQSIANLIFYNMFYEDPFNEAAGTKLKEFLKRGSSVDFKTSLNELVGYDFGEDDMIGAITEPIKEFNRSYLDQVDISTKSW